MNVTMTMNYNSAYIFENGVLGSVMLVGLYLYFSRYMWDCALIIAE